MKKRLIALLLAFTLLLAAAPTAAAYSAEEQRDIVYDLIELLQTTALEGSEEDDPLYEGLKKLFERDPAAYELLMSAMLDQYDSHTMYIPAGIYSAAFPATEEYVGVGVTMQADPRGALVTEVNPVGPAALAGVQEGDVIVAVDGASVAGYELTDISGLLRGERNTWVSVTVLRGGKELSFRLARVSIGEPNFEGYLFEDGVYYMKWTRMSTTESYVRFTWALQEMCELGAGALILDLRGNPGGELNMGFNVVDQLLPDVCEYFRIGWREDGEMAYESFTSSGSGPRLNGIVILTDDETASAAEVIVCGLVDTGYAVSVGAQTYGKARAQYHYSLEDDAAIVLTVYQLCSISRPDYEGVGLEPTYLVMNEYGTHPAASCAPVPEQAIPLGNCSDNAEALNAALRALGYLKRQEKPYLFSAETLLALDRLCVDHGMAAPQKGLTVEAARLVNECLRDKAENDIGLVDWQLDTALELAREAAKQPLQYTVDRLGNIRNIEK